MSSTLSKPSLFLAISALILAFGVGWASHLIVKSKNGNSSTMPVNTPPVQSVADANAAIDQYLAANLLQPANGGVVFCSHEILDQQGSAAVATEYIYALCQEYSLDAGNLKKGAETAVPAALVLQEQSNRYAITNFQTPDSTKTLQDIFPQNVLANPIFSGNVDPNYYTQHVENLQGIIMQAAKSHFAI